MKNRCVIYLGEWLHNDSTGALYTGKSGDYVLAIDGFVSRMKRVRVYGSHSEAKKQLPKWIVEFPDARIMPAGEVV